TGQSRGLGGVFDSFLVGKVVETGVVDILRKLNPDKKYGLDFEVHDSGNFDPDIINIEEKNNLRKPKLFVEIKNIGQNDRWIGLTEEQFLTMKKNSIVGDNLDKILIIFATIRNKKSSVAKRDDLLGVYLKSSLNSKLYESFSDPEDLYVEVVLALTSRELDEKGTHFEKNYYFFETEIFQECKPNLLKRNGLTLTKANGILPRFQYDKKLPYPERFGDIKYNGEIGLYHKSNDKSNRMYIQCISDVTVSNEIIGSFHLKKDYTYEYMPRTVGRNPVLNRNNIWIAKRNVDNVLKHTTVERMKQIARGI
ncbi:MAG TPA: hypothetical protein VH878_03845, partial [Thermodesulfobacteriota bacterium]